MAGHDDIWDCHTHIFGPWADFPLPDDPTYQPQEAPFATLRALHADLADVLETVPALTPHGVPLVIDHMGRLPVMQGRDPAPLLRLLRQACADAPAHLNAILGTNPARLYG
ncbi:MULTISPECIES: hypothetical protein [unclassified Achromobacter]|uniref:hypothetical protein n=1 Tax=unclassified Achromobacter TaxID=2626865 RepID=UPI0018E9D051|nr:MULTISPECIES: hypothetical protein [unclassified Achromobacter]